jgi:hypothetical protein
VKFVSKNVSPHIKLRDDEMELSKYWGQETSKHSVDIMRKKGPVSENEIKKDLDNHNLSVKSEFAVDIFLHKSVKNAIENSQLFCNGISIEPLIPDNLINCLFDYDTGTQLADSLGIEVKSTNRKDYLENLNLSIKPPQLKKYESAKADGKFDSFVYVLTVTVRDHSNVICLVGFAREEDINRNAALNNTNKYGEYIIHFFDLHPMEFLTPALYKTAKTLRDYVDE